MALPEDEKIKSFGSVFVIVTLNVIYVKLK